MGAEKGRFLGVWGKDKRPLPHPVQNTQSPVPQEGVVRLAASRPARSSPGARRPGALPARPDPLTSLLAEAPPSARAAPRGSARTCPRRRDHRSHFAAMLGPPVSARRQRPAQSRARAARGARAPRTRGGRRGARAPSQALAARGAAARPAHAHAHRTPAPRADPGSGRRWRGARGPARGRAAGSPRAAHGRGGRAGPGMVRTHSPGGGAGPRGGARDPGVGRGTGPQRWRARGEGRGRPRVRAPPARGVERGLSRRSGRWLLVSCWRCRRAGRGAPRRRAGGQHGRGAARTGPRSSWNSCTGDWRPACSAPSTTRCSWARASRRATPAARPGAGPPTAASGRPPTCAACRPGPTGERGAGRAGGARGPDPEQAFSQKPCTFLRGDRVLRGTRRSARRPRVS